MSIDDKIKSTLVPLNVLQSPWDDKRYLLRTPTALEVSAAPVEELHYYNNWYDYVKDYPDQETRGTCVAWCNKLDEQINEKWETGNEVDLSAEDLYWKARQYDGLPDWLGEGSNNLGAMKARQKAGLCLEETRPYNSIAITKSEELYNEECSHRAIDSYYQLSLMPSVWKTSLAGIISEPQWDGPKPIVAAYKVTQTMLDYAKEHDGLMPLDPGVDVIGGHSSLFAAYKLIDGELHFGNANSWGTDFGDDGWAWFPQTYLLNGIIMDGFVSHYGPKINIEPNPTECWIANGVLWALNAGSKLLGRRTRFKGYYSKKK